METNIINIESIGKALNVTSFDILKMLKERKYMRAIEIRRLLEKSQEKASKEIARLEGGLLIRLAVTNDDRLRSYEITEYGLEVLRLKGKGVI